MSAPRYAHGALALNLLTLAIVRPAKCDAPCPDCDGWGFHYTDRTLADPAGMVDCKGCKGDGTVKVVACMACLERPATEGVLCEVCSGAVDATVECDRCDHVGPAADFVPRTDLGERVTVCGCCAETIDEDDRGPVANPFNVSVGAWS